MDENIACPFCGNLTITIERDDLRQWGKCGFCGATGPRTLISDNTRNDLSISWNIRLSNIIPSAERVAREAAEAERERAAHLAELHEQINDLVTSSNAGKYWGMFLIDAVKDIIATERTKREKAEAEREAAQADNAKVFLDNGILERDRDAWRDCAKSFAHNFRPPFWNEENMTEGERAAYAAYDELAGKEAHDG